MQTNAFIVANVWKCTVELGNCYGKLYSRKPEIRFRKQI